MNETQPDNRQHSVLDFLRICVELVKFGGCRITPEAVHPPYLSAVGRVAANHVIANSKCKKKLRRYSWSYKRFLRWHRQGEIYHRVASLDTYAAVSGIPNTLLSTTEARM